eukprot:c11222_g2_i1.p1 GENE.c11222_g2_i1~~c11222_g2_i1.p1  ORF type:complete len:243 (-),score=57.72 c11222_g2_i1:98-826(-)
MHSTPHIAHIRTQRFSPHKKKRTQFRQTNNPNKNSVIVTETTTTTAAFTTSPTTTTTTTTTTSSASSFNHHIGVPNSNPSVSLSPPSISHTSHLSSSSSIFGSTFAVKRILICDKCFLSISACDVTSDSLTPALALSLSLATPVPTRITTHTAHTSAVAAVTECLLSHVASEPGLATHQHDGPPPSPHAVMTAHQAYRAAMGAIAKELPAIQVWQQLTLPHPVSSAGLCVGQAHVTNCLAPE